VTALVLVGASFAGLDLGLPTLIAGTLTAIAIVALKRESPMEVIGNISWSVLPLVAGLFVLVEALELTGVIRMLADGLRETVARHGNAEAAGLTGVVVAIVTNLANNLPVGLVAGSAVQQAAVPPNVSAAILIGVDLGPNLSVTGSLATILWLTALRREGLQVGAWQFLKLGLVVMPPALVLALAALIWVG
jgi:arsenical pump membrane protein